MTGPWRCDHLAGHATHTTWHETKAEADRAALLLTAGSVVVWEDPTEETP